MKLIIALLLLSLSAQAEIYKTINPDGSVSYSDVQTEHAKPVTPPGLTPTPAVKLPAKPEPVAANDETPLPYTRFDITSPKRNDTIRDNNGTVSITLTIEPKLQTKFKHTISLYLNGKQVASKLATASHTLNDVYRGRHSISAKLHDANGKVLKSSNLVFINMRRFSALNKKMINDRQTRPADPNNPENASGQTDPLEDNKPKGPWPEPQDPTKPPEVWPTLPDYSKPQNVWPTPPGSRPASPAN